MRTGLTASNLRVIDELFHDGRHSGQPPAINGHTARERLGEGRTPRSGGAVVTTALPLTALLIAPPLALPDDTIAHIPDVGVIHEFRLMPIASQLVL